ncbi:MAG: Nucleoside permease NupX [bacterium ADurb.Bin157]|nr:MAG: Nucleoside permease NupX [bacterium ADurb.Bin157]
MGTYNALLGIPVLLGICYAFSNNRKKINTRLVGFGIGLQVLFAFLILRTSGGRWLFQQLNDVVLKILSFTDAGASFVFGSLVENKSTFGFIFAFNVLPTIVFFSAFMAILYHLGIMQKVVYVIALLMQKTMGTSGAESLSAAANIFVGQTEAPLVIKPYINKMTQSELLCIMTGGMATIAGGVMAGYVGMLKDSIPGIAGYLMAASCMAAPAAMTLAKILIPETGVPETSGKLELKTESIDSNVIDACARGCSEGMGLAINVAAMLIGFTAMIAMLSFFWESIATFLGITGYTSLDSVIGLLLSPFAWLIGVPNSDISVAGALIGKKIILNEFVAYAELQKYVTDETLIMLPKTQMLLSYALCGFANFSSIGIQIAGIGGLAPERRSELAQLALRALLAGAFASFLTASIAGLFYIEPVISEAAKAM